MADTRPTKQGFLRAIYLCILVVFCPQKFIEEEEKDTKSRNNFSNQSQKEHKAYIVCKAFWKSLGLIVLSAGFGGIIGYLLRCNNRPSPTTINILQIIGAGLLLWGTLFVRGWEIQTWSGVTLGERVNRWIYCVLYCVGTSILICSLVWNF